MQSDILKRKLMQVYSRYPSLCSQENSLTSFTQGQGTPAPTCNGILTTHLRASIITSIARITLARDITGKGVIQTRSLI